MANPIEIETRRSPRMSRRDFLRRGLPTIGAGLVALNLSLQGVHLPVSADAQPISPFPAPDQPKSPLKPPTVAASPKIEAKPATTGSGKIPPHYDKHYGWDVKNPDEYEQMGPIGDQLQFGWSEIHKAPGVYDWTPLYNAINKVKDNNYKVRVEMPDGTIKEFFKPLTVSFFMYLSGNPTNPYEFTPYIPEFVRQQTDGGIYTIPSPRAECPPQVAPKYDNPVLQQYYLEFLEAFANEFGNQFFEGTDQPVFYAIEPGPWAIDAEVGNAVKNIRQSGVTCDYVNAFNQILPYWTYLDAFSRAGFDPPGTANRDILDRIVSIFSRTNIPIFISWTSDGRKKAREVIDHAADYPIPIGVRMATAVSDQSTARIIGSDGTPFGIVDIFDYAKSKGLPTAIETANYRVDPQRKYLTLIAMLTTAGPELVQLLSLWFDDIKNDPALAREFKYFYRFIGKTPEIGPEVWTVLRDTDFPLKYIGSVRYGGFAGDFNFGIERVPVRQDTTVVYGDNQETGAWAPRNPALPSPAKDHLWGLRARGNTPDSRYMFFRVNQQWADSKLHRGSWGAYNLRLRIVNNDSGTIDVCYRNKSTGAIERKTIQKGPSLGPMNQFVEVSVPLLSAYIGGSLEGGTDFYLDAGEHGQMIVQSLFLGPAKIFDMIFPMVQKGNYFPFTGR